MHHLRLLFESADPLPLSQFWAKLTGYETARIEEDMVCLEGTALGAHQLVFVEVETWKAAPNRVQPDLAVTDLDLEIGRTQTIGGTLIEVIDATRWRQGRRAIFRDPEGNEFALVEIAAEEAA